MADEPTGNLDEDTGQQIIELLFAGHQKRGTTLVLVTHDQSLAARCGRTVRLRSGHIVRRIMSIAALAPVRGNRWLPLQYALRELRGGLRGFYVFIACIALGSMAIAGVGSLAASLADGLARQGRVILGGDLAFTLIQREATPPELAFLNGQGKVSSAATMRAMARTPDGKATLVELKAVDSAYPLFGKVKLEPARPLADALAQRDGAFGAAADPVLLARLGVKPGARLTIGNAPIEIRAALGNEPDKLAGGIGFGPRLLVSEDALRATGLIQPGSLVRWLYRLRLPQSDANDAALKAVTTQAREQLPEAGWDVRNPTNASPQLERNVERFTQFLTIVGLTALLVGGVGVGNAVKSHLDRKREVIATMKALGASGRRVFAVYLTQVLLLALIGGVLGAVLGAVLPYAIAWTFGAIIPLPFIPAMHPAELGLAVVYALLTALAFALWPLGRAHDGPGGRVVPRRASPPSRAGRVKSTSRSLPRRCWLWQPSQYCSLTTGAWRSSTSRSQRWCSSPCASSPAY